MSTGEYRLLETLNDMKQLETMCSLQDRRSCGAVTSACTIRGMSHQGVPCFSLFLLHLSISGCTGLSFLLSRAGFLQRLRAGAPLSLQCSGFPLRWPLLLQSAASRRPGFSSCGSPALEHGLSCSVACGIFPDQGWSCALAGRFFTTEPPGKPCAPILPSATACHLPLSDWPSGESRTLSPKGLETILGPLGKSRILAQESRYGPTFSEDFDLIIFFFSLRWKPIKVFIMEQRG